MITYYVATLIFATAMMLVAFMLVTSGSFQQFKENWNKRAPRITELPIITPSGQIVNSVEDLDMQLEFLENQLEEKEKELESTKTKQETTADRLEKLTDTTNQIKKYYVKLKSEIIKSESEINDLRNQIDDYKKRQMRLREEVNENVKYYTGMLNNIEVASEGYEIVKKYLVAVAQKDVPQKNSDRRTNYSSKKGKQSLIPPRTNTDNWRRFFFLQSPLPSLSAHAATDFIGNRASAEKGEVKKKLTPLRQNYPTNEQ